VIKPQDQSISGTRPVHDVVARLQDLSAHDQVPMGDLIRAFGDTSFVPALMVPALLVVSPLSGLPFFSSVCGLTIAVIAAQMVWGRDHLSLPGVVMRRQVRGTRLRAALHRMGQVADWLDAHTRKRFAFLICGAGRIVPQILCLVIGAVMPFFEIMPFSSSILGFAVLCFAISLLSHDGAFVLVGMAAMAVAGAVPVILLPQMIEAVL